MQGKLLRQTLDKFLKAPAAQEARVQVCLPDGQFFDIRDIKLLENKLLGVRETHRLVITVQREQVQMGTPIKKL